MLDRLLTVAALLSICAIGFVALMRRNLRIGEQSEFAVEYLTKLRDYLSSEGRDYKSYAWLTHRSDRMQRELGTLGIFETYRPPFANYMHRNVPAIFTLLPELRRCFEDNVLHDKDITQQYGATLQEIVVRHLGSLDDDGKNIARSLKNPFVWFREGARVIVGLPVSLLGWLGVVTAGTAYRITQSSLFRVIGGLAALVGFVSAVVGLVLGWEQFTEVVAGWMAK